MTEKIAVEIFTSVLMIIIVVAMISMLATARTLLLAQRFTNIILINVIFFFAYYKVIMYYALPLVMNMLSNYRYIKEDHVDLITLTYLYAVELSSWIAWFAGIFIISHAYRNRQVLKTDTSLIELNENKNKWILIVTSLAFILFSFVSLSALDSNESAFPWYVEIFRTLIVYTSLSGSLLLLVLGFTRWGWMYGSLGVVAVVSVILLYSTRGSLVYSILFLSYLFIYFSRSKKSLVLVAINTSVFAAVYFSFGGLPSLSLDIGNSNQPSISAYIDTEKKSGRSVLEEIENRFGATTRLSTKFIEMYDRGDGAGINPIKNSILGFMPRSINPDKPFPSTVDGNDLYSQGMYLIYRETYGYNTHSMAEFSTGGHAYWEFGWIGVLVLSTISGIYIGLCAYFFQGLGLMSIPLLVSTFKPWGYVDPKIWVSDIIIQIYQIIFPLILIILIIMFLGFVNRYKYNMTVKESLHNPDGSVT